MGARRGQRGRNRDPLNPANAANLPTRHCGAVVADLLHMSTPHISRALSKSNGWNHIQCKKTLRTLPGIIPRKRTMNVAIERAKRHAVCHPKIRPRHQRFWGAPSPAFGRWQVRLSRFPPPKCAQNANKKREKHTNYAPGITTQIQRNQSYRRDLSQKHPPSPPFWTHFTRPRPPLHHFR